ncbi:MAG: hypothetical protein M3438_09140 [Pseudomonadota bacterium]|nr:hypothetical protein [Sphingomonas sp.]MDQ3479307.1 hypothetical protein [Pseudomonadota bacterium]
MTVFSMKKKLLVASVLAGVAAPVIASHSWSNYHWARTTAELQVPVGDNVNSVWQSYLDTAVVDWNKSTVINSPLVAGSSNPKRCNAIEGTIQVCNERYGRTGWLGIASIWLSGGHISKGTTKVNDTYFNTAQYNTPAWRALVMYQEIGHDYGLGHQDEDFNTDLTESCMDYTNLPGGNEHPDAHDYEQLLAMYNHTESGATITSRAPASNAESGDTPADWGRAVHFTKDGRPDVFVQDLGNGNRKITHVFWAIGEGPRNVRHHR